MISPVARAKTVAAEATKILGGAVRGAVVYDHKILL
jgi:hypothetical protein